MIVKIIMAVVAALLMACIVTADEFDSRVEQFAANTAKLKKPKSKAACDCGCKCGAACPGDGCDCGCPCGVYWTSPDAGGYSYLWSKGECVAADHATWARPQAFFGDVSCESCGFEASQYPQSKIVRVLTRARGVLAGCGTGG